MLNARHQKILAAMVTVAAIAIGLVGIALNAPLAAAEKDSAHYVLQMRLSTGESVPLGEITVFGKGSWSYSVSNDLVSGTFYFGELPARPDPKVDKVAMFEVSKDDGATGTRGVFERFPESATVLVYKNGKLQSETTIKQNPADL